MENVSFFAKFRRKLRTKNFEAHFHRKLRTFEKCSNVKKLRTVEPQPIFTGSYKKNAAKRSRQHAGGKYREYAQRSVFFVNNQVP